jgi:hypothetical protein
MNTTSPQTSTQPKFDEWALIELFGHQRIVGKVTEASIAGGAFVRVDVPNSDGTTRFTRFYGPSAIYSINPVSREIALVLAERQNVEPVSRYELKQLPPVQGEPDDRDDNDDTIF